MTMNSDAAIAENEVRGGENNAFRSTDRVIPIVEKRDIYQEVEALRRDLEVQAAAQAGALATQAAVQAGALATATATEAGATATLAATQAGAVATQAAMQAGQAAATSAAIMGIWSTLVGTLAALVAGIVLGGYLRDRDSD
jgi:hypothetical protein